MIWERTGTISVTNGSAVVNGIGTDWTAPVVKPGYILITADGNLYEIESLSSGTQVTLSEVYMGATNGAANYVIIPTIGANVDLHNKLVEVIEIARNPTVGAMVYKDDWDASSGTFPGAGAALKGWLYHVNVAGVVDGIEFAVGDNIVAKTDNASTTIYAANWSKHDQTDAVTAVAGLVGSISASALLTALGIEAGATADQTNEEIRSAYNALVEVVSQADAEAGTSNAVRRWTPERINQAIQALAPPSGAVNNLIINGAMQVAQRGTSFPAISSGEYFVDRFQVNGNIGTWTASQDTDAPDGFAYSYKLLLTSGFSLGSTSYWAVQQKIEGQNLQMLKYGKVNALPVTLGFWVKSNKTGNFCVNLYHPDSSKNYPNTYTVNSADTWEFKTISYSGDVAAALDNDANESLRVVFLVAAGSVLTSGTVGERVSYTDATFAAGQSAQVSATNDYINITGVQLVAGETLPSFKHEPYGDVLQKCKRYFEIVDFYSEHIGNGDGAHNFRGRAFSVHKRTIPSLTNNLSVTGSPVDVNLATIRGFRFGRGGDNSVIIGLSGTVEADAEL
ncbi:MAG: hypothetical protein ACU0AU_04840 [Cognatishimia activa]